VFEFCRIVVRAKERVFIMVIDNVERAFVGGGAMLSGRLLAVVLWLLLRVRPGRRLRRVLPS